MAPLLICCVLCVCYVRLSSAESAPLVEIADERFFWNRWLCQPFLDSKVAPYWLVPIVQGDLTT